MIMAYAADAANKAVNQDRGTRAGDGQSTLRSAESLNGTCLSVSIDMYPPASAILAKSSAQRAARRAGHGLLPRDMNG
jgi:hypothetical protein